MYKDRKKYLEAQLRYNQEHRAERRALAVKWRKENKEKKKEYDKKYNREYELLEYVKIKRAARRLLRNKVKQGKIIKTPCIKCGNEKSQGHHSDYSKPLKVIWLCHKHHMELHRKID